MEKWLKKYQYIQHGAVQTCQLAPELMTRSVGSEIVCGYILYSQQRYNNGNYAQKWIIQYYNNQYAFPTVSPHEQKQAQHIHLITLHFYHMTCLQDNWLIFSIQGKCKMC